MVLLFQVKCPLGFQIFSIDPARLGRKEGKDTVASSFGSQAIPKDQGHWLETFI